MNKNTEFPPLPEDCSYECDYECTGEEYNDKKFDPNEPATYIQIRHVKHGVIAWLAVGNGIVKGNSAFIAFNVYVEPLFRRKGLATALYDLAEQFADIDIVPSEELSEEAKEFWNDRKIKKGTGRLSRMTSLFKFIDMRSGICDK